MISLNYKRTISMLLAMIMLGSSAAGCSETTTPEETEESTVQEAGVIEESETEKRFLDNLPESMDFGERDIRFLSAIEDYSITLEDGVEYSGDVVKNAYWERNQALEERLNVNVVLADYGYNEFNGRVSASVKAGTQDYDILCGHCGFNIVLSSMGYVMNMNNYEFTDYIDLSQPYWSDMFIDSITYRDNLFWLAGDMTHRFIAFAYETFVNATIWDNYHSDKNIYDIVFEGKWTMDKLNELSEGTYLDKNSNEKKDTGDCFGIAIHKGHISNGMAFALNIQYTERNEDNEPVIALNNEHTMDAMAKLARLAIHPDYSITLGNDEYMGTGPSMFRENRLLFLPYQFELTEQLREMESDFYIIPLPKYDENQQDYRINQYDGVAIYGVPVTTDKDDIPMIASFLEAMCSMTSKTVIPAYYDVALKNKYSRDPIAAQMIDLIRASITSDFGFFCVGGMMSFAYENVTNENVASSLKGKEKAWEKTLKKTLEKLEKHGDK